MIFRTPRPVVTMIVVFGVYLAASFVLFDRPGILNGAYYLGNGADPYLYMWSFYFIPHALFHGLNPFLISAAWAPAGLNITQATTTPGIALLAWPLTALVGPIISFNVVTLLTPALSAATAFLLSYLLCRRMLASFVAGWIFGFSTFEFGALQGHLQTDFVPFLPLAFLLVALRAQSRLAAPAYVVGLAAVNVFQFSISLETFVTTTLFLSLFFIVQALIRMRSQGWQSALFECVLFALSFVITAIIVSPYIYYFFIDYNQIPHVLMDGGRFSIDFLNFIIPTIVTWIGHDLAAPIAAHFMPDISEELGYIGLPLVVLTIVAVARTWRDTVALSTSIVIVVACVCAMGPVLTLDGKPEFDLPWMVISHLPLLANVITGRLMVYAMLGIGLVCSLWLGGMGRGYYSACVGVFAAALLMLPNSHSDAMTGWYNKVPAPTLVRTDVYRHYIERGSTVMVLPVLAANGDAILWQIETKGYFRILDGYGDFVPPPFVTWPVVQMIDQGVVGPDFSQQFNLFMKHFNVRTVLAPPVQRQIWGNALKASGWRETMIGRVGLFQMDARSWATLPTLSEADAVYAMNSQHMAALEHAATCMMNRGAHKLYPDAAIAAGCLSPAFGSVPGPVTNWDHMSGWLGFLGQKVGVSVVTNGVVANRLIKKFGSGVSKIYFPYPHIYDAKTAPSVSWGQLILSYDPDSLKSSKPN